MRISQEVWKSLSLCTFLSGVFVLFFNRELQKYSWLLPECNDQLPMQNGPINQTFWIWGICVESVCTTLYDDIALMRASCIFILSLSHLWSWKPSEPRQPRWLIDSQVKATWQQDYWSIEIDMVCLQGAMTALWSSVWSHTHECTCMSVWA